jgi:hypothetical protein
MRSFQLRDNQTRQAARAESSFAAAAERLYQDGRCVERSCPVCNQLYRGRMLVCSLKCAVADD